MITRPIFLLKRQRPNPESIAINTVIIAAILLLVAFAAHFKPWFVVGALILGLGGTALWATWSVRRYKRRMRDLAFDTWMKVIQERAEQIGEPVDLADPFWRESFEAKVPTREALFQWRLKTASPPRGNILRP